jgi:hypothetical protein
LSSARATGRNSQISSGTKQERLGKAIGCFLRMAVDYGFIPFSKARFPMCHLVLSLLPGGNGAESKTKVSLARLLEDPTAFTQTH